MKIFNNLQKKKLIIIKIKQFWDIEFTIANKYLHLDEFYFSYLVIETI